MEAAAIHAFRPLSVVPSPAPESDAKGGLSVALAELEESTARVVSVRQKVERLAAELTGRQQAVLSLERELSAARASAKHDREAIARLELDLEGRADLLNRLRSELTALAGELTVS